MEYKTAQLNRRGLTSVRIATHRHDTTLRGGNPVASSKGMTYFNDLLAKWQTADPMGYPDGWNALAYCGNGVTVSVDLWGCEKVLPDGGDTRWAPFDALALAVSVKWDCNHNFDNPSFSSRISTSGDTGEITIDYKSDTNAILKFSAIKVKDTATFLPGISTSFDHAWKLLVEIEVYVTIAYLDSNGSVQVDQFLNRRLLFDTVHWISKMWE